MRVEQLGRFDGLTVILVRHFSFLITYFLVRLTAPRVIRDERPIPDQGGFQPRNRLRRHQLTFESNWRDQI